MKDFLVNTVSSLILAAAAWAFNRYAMGNAEAGIAEFWASLGVVALVVSLMVTLRLNRLRDAYVTAHSFDYKFYAEPGQDKEGRFNGLYRMFGQSGIGSIGQEPVTKKAGTDGYISAENFFAKESPFMAPGLFECHAVRNNEKPGKMFVQLSFIPVDKEGRTILIRRDPLYHGSEFGSSKKAALSFLSFSPIPTRFHVNKFLPIDAYLNEVPRPWGPLADVSTEFEELGAVIRFDGKNKATYLFYVFAVRYPDICFSGKTDGVTNLKWLFFRDERAWKKRTPFGKDHDAIAAVIGIRNLLDYVLRGDLPSTGNGVGVFEAFRLRRLLRCIKFREAERRALQDLAGSLID